MKQINDTTFISDNLGDLKPLVTIGGKPVDKFIPNLNISFHDDEFFINLNRRDKQATSATDKAEIYGIDKDIFYIDADGRFKWDIEFKERPSKNSWTWELKHTDGIEFYYQGELTAEEIADGCERPLEVVGSYAVYCDKANNKYKTGKLCHIYRPFCYDINGESIYADLLIADGQLTITIDETWLDDAVYPVRLDPTFGYTSVGASTDNFGGLFAAKAQTNPSSDGTLDSIYLYVNGNTTSRCNVALFSNSSDNPSSRLAQNISGPFLPSPAQWLSCSLSASIILNTQYWFVFDGLSATLNYYFDTGSSGDGKTSQQTAFPESWTNQYTSSWRVSCYGSYTESGGASGHPTASRLRNISRNKYVRYH